MKALIAQAELFSVQETGLVKTFNIVNGNVPPPISLDEGTKRFDCSDKYVSKIETIAGNETYSVCLYDFRDQKWRSPMAGLKRVIEYYTE